MKTYRVVVVGAGSIGAMKNDKYDSPNTKNILTWAHAIKKCSKTDLTGIMDIDFDRATVAGAKWDCFPVHYDFLEEFIKSQEIDIVIVSSPTATHYSTLKRLVTCDFKLIIVEKPFTNSLAQAKEIKKIYKERNIPIMINYSRKFLPITHTVKKAIDANVLGKIQQCRVLYNRGFKREASHALNLMCYFFGKFKDGKILDKSNPLCDYSNEDPSYNVYLSFEKCKNVFFASMDGRVFSIFEIDIIGEKARYTFIDHGKDLLTYKVIPEPTYGDYNTICYTSGRFVTHLTRSLLFAVRNAIDYLEGKQELLCTIDEAIKVHEIIHPLGINKTKEIVYNDSLGGSTYTDT